MKFKQEMDVTDNSQVYVRARKRFLEGQGSIKCSFCPYHRGENAHHYQRNWKKCRKTQHKN